MTEHSCVVWRESAECEVLFVGHIVRNIVFCYQLCVCFKFFQCFTMAGRDRGRGKRSPHVSTEGEMHACEEESMATPPR